MGVVMFISIHMPPGEEQLLTRAARQRQDHQAPSRSWCAHHLSAVVRLRELDGRRLGTVWEVLTVNMSESDTLVVANLDMRVPMTAVFAGA